MGWTACSKQGQAMNYGRLEGHPELKVVDLKQEAGLVSSSDGKPLDFAKYPLGTILRLEPFHSCAHTKQHDRIHVLAEDRTSVIPNTPLLQLRAEIVEVVCADFLEVANSVESRAWAFVCLGAFATLKAAMSSLRRICAGLFLGTALAADESKEPKEILNLLFMADIGHSRAHAKDLTKQWPMGKSAYEGAFSLYEGMLDFVENQGAKPTAVFVVGDVAYGGGDPHVNNNTRELAPFTPCYYGSATQELVVAAKNITFEQWRQNWLTAFPVSQCGEQPNQRCSETEDVEGVVGHCEAAALAKRSIQDPSRAHLWVVSAMRAADSAALPWMSMLLAPAASTAQWRDAPVVMLTGRVAGLTTIPCGRTLTPTWPAQGEVPLDWLRAQRRQRCTVCGLSVSTRHGVHPTCRPAARAAAAAGVPRSAEDAAVQLPEFDAIQSGNTRTLRHVPAAARALWGRVLARALADVVLHNDSRSWKELLMLPQSVLGPPPRGGRRHHKAAASYTKDRLQRWEGFDRKACNALVAEGLCGETAETAAALQALHPSQPSPNPDMSNLPLANEVVPDAVARALRSFPADTAPGPSGLRIQHLREAGPPGDNLALMDHQAAVVSLLARGQACPEAAPALAGAGLVAVPKPKGGVRPIAIGEVLRRLTGKCLMAAVHDEPLITADNMAWREMLLKAFLKSSLSNTLPCWWRWRSSQALVALRASPLELACFYLDDGILAGDVAVVGAALQRKAVEGAAVGLTLNLDKFELICAGAWREADRAAHFLPPLLRAPDGRPSPLLRWPLQLLLTADAGLGDFDDMVRTCFSSVTGLHLTAQQWEQAERDLAHAGLGLRSVLRDAPAAYLASALVSRADAASWERHLAASPVTQPALLRSEAEQGARAWLAAVPVGRKRMEAASLVAELRRRLGVPDAVADSWSDSSVRFQDFARLLLRQDIETVCRVAEIRDSQSTSNMM
eukprot:s4152_g7.t1